VIGGFVRWLSMLDVESLCEEAGLGRPKNRRWRRSARSLGERFEPFCRRSLYDVKLVVLFLDATISMWVPAGRRRRNLRVGN
jgi:hypothetical protein